MEFQEYMDLPAGKDDCQICNGSGDVQCCAGEHYYTDTCDCVMVEHYKSEKYKDLDMSKFHQKMLDRTIELRNM